MGSFAQRPGIFAMKYFKNILSADQRRIFCTNREFARPYQDIPGPKGPLGFGNIFKYLPVVGGYSWKALHKAGADKYKKYGPIVKETMVPGEDIVWLYDPKDISILLNAKEHPLRRSHLALEKYRKDRPHVYRTAGLLPTNGDEWWGLRSELQKEISPLKNVRSYIFEADQVTKEFLDYLPKNKDCDMLPKLARLNLEITCLVTFGERMNSFDATEQASNSVSSKLIQAAETTNSNILPTDQGLRLWRYFKTLSYRRIYKAQEFMEDVAVNLVSRKRTFRKETSTEGTEKPSPLPRDCLIEQYLKNSNLELCDVVGTAADYLLAGIDTTSYTTAFALYYISRHPQMQDRLHEEALKVLKESDSPLLGDSLQSSIPYTKAVLKEVFRLNPISVGVGRILTRDLILGGYHVPKQTVVVTQNMIACRLEQNFENALEFQPERWLSKNRSHINPYLVLPFGHGMRACIARRLAEQNILAFLIRLMRNYKITWQGAEEEMDVVTLLINKPSLPVIIQLEQRI